MILLNSLRRSLRLGLYSFGLAGSLVLLGANMSVPSSTEPVVFAVPEPKPVDTSAALDQARQVEIAQSMQLAIDTWAARQEADVSVVIESLTTGVRASHNIQQTYVSASLYKPYTAYELLLQEQVNPGLLETQATPEYNTAECLELMIIISDNLCAFNIGRTVGWERTNQTLRSLGITDTNVDNYAADGSLDGDKYTTASDMSIFLRELYTGDNLDPEYRDLLIGYMLAQELNDTLPLQLPSSIEIAHKTANTDGFVHDAGYIIGPSDSYSYAVLTSGQDSLEAGNQNIRSLLAELVTDIDKVVEL